MEKDTLYRVTSEFDMGVSILIRINEILNHVAEARIEGDFKTWRDCLMAVSGEIEDTYSPTEEEDLITLLEEINPLILKWSPRVAFGNSTPRNDLTGEEYNELYLKMRELDKFVRAQLNKRNMLLRKAGDMTKASGRMG